MLRSTLLGVASLLAIFGIFRVSAGDATAWPMAIWGVVLVFAVVFERWRYRQHGETDIGGEWQATEERFIDPETGRLVQVFYQPATGKRRYVPVGDAD